MAAAELAIDYGTSNTVAVLRRAGSPPRPLLFDGSPLLPSAVWAERGGELHTGQDALRGGRRDPERFEPNPKRRIDDLDVMLGERIWPLAELFAATLSTVHGEARRVLGGASPDRVVLTHPVAWGQARRALLRSACARAGLARVEFVPEPVAAATYLAVVAEHEIPTGRAVLVYDLGAGTFDATVVRRTDTGFAVLASRGLDDVGGLDLDAVVVQLAGRQLAGAERVAWDRVLAARDAAARRLNRQLWDDARAAKETLSRRSATTLAAPGGVDEIMITREEFERAAEAVLEGTVKSAAATLKEARVRDDELAALFLVGGGSRIPLIATLLLRALGIAPTVLEHPEMVVAEGALAALGQPELTSPDVEVAIWAPPVLEPAGPAEAPPPQPPTMESPSMEPPSKEPSAFAAPDAILAPARDDPPATATDEPAVAVTTLQRETQTALEPVEPPAEPPARGADFRGRRLLIAVIAAVVLFAGGTVIALLTRDSGTGHSSISGVAFTADGRHVVTVGREGTAMVWDVSGDEPKRLATVDVGQAVHAVTISSNGKLAALTGQQQIILWNIADLAHPAKIATIPGSIAYGNRAQFGDQDRLLLTKNGETPELWDIGNPAAPSRLSSIGEPPRLQVAVMSSDGRRLMADPYPGLPLMWNLTDRSNPVRGAVLTKKGGDCADDASGDQSVDSAALDRAGNRLVLGAGSGCIFIWDVSVATTPLLTKAFVIGAGAAEVIALTADGGTLVVGSDANAGTVWSLADPASPRQTATLPGTDRMVGAAFSPDGRTLAYVDDANRLHMRAV